MNPVREPTAASGRRRAPTRSDLVVLCALAAAVLLAARWSPAAAPGAALRLQAAGGVSRYVDPRADATYELAGPVGRTVVQVEHGEAWIVHSDCRNRLCMRMGRLRGPGRALVCMPNRVLVRFDTAPEVSAPDAITR